MLATPRSEPVRETPKVLLIDLLKNGSHRLLNDFVLQGGHPERALPPIGLRNVHFPRRLRSVRAAVNPAVQVNKPTLQSSFILLPSDAVHARCGSSLQSVKALPEQID